MPAEAFPIEFQGTVVRGKGLGRVLGFPTANLAMDCARHLRYGVYAAQVLLDGVWFDAIANAGRHPTLPEGQPAVEVHIPGHAVDLYGRTITVRLVRFLRSERRFDTAEALAEQIGKDIASLGDGGR